MKDQYWFGILGASLVFIIFISSISRPDQYERGKRNGRMEITNEILDCISKDINAIDANGILNCIRDANIETGKIIRGEHD